MAPMEHGYQPVFHSSRVDALTIMDVDTGWHVVEIVTRLMKVEPRNAAVPDSILVGLD
jgi:hypothetical protein